MKQEKYSTANEIALPVSLNAEDGKNHRKDDRVNSSSNVVNTINTNVELHETNEKDTTKHNGRASSGGINETTDNQDENMVQPTNNHLTEPSCETEDGGNENMSEIQDEEDEEENNINEHYTLATEQQYSNSTTPTTATTATAINTTNNTRSNDSNLKGARKRKRGQKAKSAALESRPSDEDVVETPPQRGDPKPHQQLPVDKMDNSLLTISEAIDAVTTLTEENEEVGGKEEEDRASKFAKNTRTRRAAKRTNGMIYDLVWFRSYFFLFELPVFIINITIEVYTVRP